MNDSVDYIKSNVDFVSDLRGGEGAFREIADLILASQNKLEKIVATFLQK
jgi:3-deoxy-D-manno-octulosonate 8-phosphate phosphatase (KDO 8-P phosphatase)